MKAVANGQGRLVDVHVGDRLAVVTLDSPRNGNALSRQLVAELSGALQELAEAQDVQVVHLRSSSRVFCSGADLTEATSGGIEDTASSVVKLQRLIAAGPWPVVVELAGPARAGGLGIVAAADIVVAAESVTFQLTESRLGLAPAVILVALTWRMHSRALADAALTARPFDAAAAQRAGLVSRVATDTELGVAVAEVIAELMDAVPQGLRETKALLNAGLVRGLDDQGPGLARRSAELFASPAAQAAMSAFLSDRASRAAQS